MEPNNKNFRLQSTDTLISEARFYEMQKTTLIPHYDKIVILCKCRKNVMAVVHSGTVARVRGPGASD